MHLKLDSILAFTLIIPFIMGYRIGPGDTPYWLFGLIFFGMVSYIVLDIKNLSQRRYDMLKNIILWSLIVIVIGSAFISAIFVRHQTAPIYMVHDIIIQQESAIRFLLHGKNPYATTYFGTPLEQWHYSDTDVNPALYHFVMQPFYLIFSIPFYLISTRTLGYFDGRMPLLFLFLMTLVIGNKLIKNGEYRRAFLTLLAFNPSMLPYTLEGRSDIFMYAFLITGFYLLYVKKEVWAGITIALAFLVKQSAWPLFPFYVGYLYFKKKNLIATFYSLVPFVITVTLIAGPFILWDGKAFIDSTVLYLSGNVAHSYPVSGYGFGKILQDMGVLKDVHAYYPFIVWQLLICGPFLLLLLMMLRRKTTVKSLVIVYGIFLFIYWYFSRYFNNSHLSYLSMIFITAYFWPQDEQNINEKKQ